MYRKPRGIEATLATVELIRRAIVDGSRSLRVRKRAVEIVHAAGVCPKDYPGELRALFDYCSRKLRYTRDPATAELVHSSGRLLGEIDQRGYTAGDCDDQTVMLGSLAASIGLPVAIRIVGARPGAFSHVHLRVRAGPLWVPADLTAWPRHGLGYEPRAPAERVFLLDGKEVTGMQHYMGTLHGIGEGVYSEADIAGYVGALGYSAWDIQPDGTLVGIGGPDGLGELGFFSSIVSGFRAVGGGIARAASTVGSVASQAAPLVGIINPGAGASLAAAGQVGRGVSSAFRGGGGGEGPGGVAPRAAPPPPRAAPPPAAAVRYSGGGGKPVPPRPAPPVPRAIYKVGAAPSGSGTSGGSFFDKYKWPLLIGGVAVAGGAAYLLTRKKGRRR